MSRASCGKHLLRGSHDLVGRTKEPKNESDNEQSAKSPHHADGRKCPFGPRRGRLRAQVCFKMFTRLGNDVPSVQNGSDLLLRASRCRFGRYITGGGNTVASNSSEGGLDQSGSVQQWAVTKRDKRKGRRADNSSSPKTSAEAWR